MSIVNSHPWSHHIPSLHSFPSAGPRRRPTLGPGKLASPPLHFLTHHHSAPPAPPAMSAKQLCDALAAAGFDGDGPLDPDSLEWAFLQGDDSRRMLAWISARLRPGNVISAADLELYGPRFPLKRSRSSQSHDQRLNEPCARVWAARLEFHGDRIENRLRRRGLEFWMCDRDGIIWAWLVGFWVRF